MTHLPPEGSSYDKVLAWAQLFAERLNLFDLEISEFAVDSFRAAELAYGYCAILLEVRSALLPDEKDVLLTQLFLTAWQRKCSGIDDYLWVLPQHVHGSDESPRAD